MTTDSISPFIEYKLRLKGDPIQGMQKPPTLGVDVRKNNVSITCWTGGKDGEGRNANIRAGLDAFSFAAVCAGLEDAIAFQPTADKPSFRVPVRCYTPRKRNPGEQGLPKTLAATVVVGKDKDGCVYISVVRKDPPHIKFIFRPSEYHEIMAAEGQGMADQAYVSVIYARAWLKIMQPLALHVLATQVSDWREDQNNNGGNNNQQQQQQRPNNQQSNNSSDGFDDDIPL